MVNINHTEISMDDYREIESRIDSMMSEEELIETHKKLIGNSCKCAYWDVKDCGVEFINKFLSRDYARTIVYHYSQGAEKFIQSKYLSDYFKTSIRELLSDEDLSDEVLNALNSDKVINDMSEEEILSIDSAIKDFYTKSPRTKKVSAANYLMSLLYKLNGSGVVSFIKNNVNNRDLASHILKTSGLNDRASYYSGRGVNYGDLNENNLVAIFSKLFKVDEDYATNFVEMVRQMKTLGATEFINSFMSFAANGFKSNQQNSAINRGNDNDYEIMASEQMKNSFMSRIRPVLQSINPDYDGLDGQSFDSGYPTKRI